MNQGVWNGLTLLVTRTPGASIETVAVDSLFAVAQPPGRRPRDDRHNTCHEAFQMPSP